MAFASGNAGEVALNIGGAPTVDAVDYGGFVNGDTHGTGAGGSVMVMTGALLLDGHGDGNTEIGASAVGSRSGNAGAVTVSAGNIIVQGRARIASSTGMGAGSIIVSTPRPYLRNGASISTAAQRAYGGNITIGSGNSAFGNGSNITVDPRLAVLDRSQASPRSSLIVTGRGGQRQGLEATLPAPYLIHRPVRDGERRAPAASDIPARTSIGLSRRCG